MAALTVIGALSAIVIAAIVGVVLWRSYKERNRDEHQCTVEMGDDFDKGTIDTRSTCSGVPMFGEVTMGSRDII